MRFAGWLVALIVIVRYRQLQRIVISANAALEQAIMALARAEALTADVYRIHLTCPWCDWEEDLVRESHETALAAGQARIDRHNREADHPVTGRTARAGYYKGDPLN